jgi:hypothetical protein
MTKPTSLRRHLVWLPVAGLTLALLGQAAVYRFEPPTTVLHASWYNSPTDLSAASAKAPFVIQAEVLRVEKGDDIVTPARGEPNDEDRIPTQRVTMRVLKSLKGTLKDGETVQLFQTGGELKLPSFGTDGPPKDQVMVQAKKVILEGDPLYTVGEQHLLMLEPGPSKLLRIVAPETRFKIERGGTLVPAIDNETTAPMKGRNVAELEKLVLSSR